MFSHMTEIMFASISDPKPLDTLCSGNYNGDTDWKNHIGICCLLFGVLLVWGENPNLKNQT